MAVLYVRNAGGNSNDTNTYSLLGPGGSAAGVLPTIADDIIVASTVVSFTQNAALACRSIDFDNPLYGSFAGTFTHNASQLLSIGDGTASTSGYALRFSNAMTYIRGGSANVTFGSGPATPEYILTRGKQIGTVIFGNTANGNWELLDAANSAGAWTWVRGTFKSNGFDLTGQTFNSNVSTARNLNFEGSFLYSQGTGGITPLNFQTATNLTLSALTATLVIAGSASTKSIQLGSTNIVWGIIKYDAPNSSGRLNFGGTYGTVRKLIFHDSVTTREIAFATNGWNILDWSDVYGRSGANLTILSTAAGTKRFVRCTAPTIQSVQYCNVKDIAMEVPNKFYALNSTDQGNNDNVTFGSPGNNPLPRQFGYTSQISQNSVTYNFEHQAQAGNLLVVVLSILSDPGTINVPTGWVLADESTRGTANYVKMYYKVADGSETSVTFSWTTARTSRLFFDETYNWQGVPTLDTTDKNNSGSTSSFDTGAGVANTAAPGHSYAIMGCNGGMGVTTAPPTNDYKNYWNSDLENSATITKMAARTLPDIASRTTTFSWTTARQAASLLVNFIDVTGGKIKYKSGGTFHEYDHKAKVAGVFN